MLRTLLVLLASVFSTCSFAADWLHWRGTGRSGVVMEASGWDGKNWIKGEVWRLAVGEGSSSPLVIGNQVYLTGWRDNRDSVICVDATSGREVWRQSYACPRYGRFAVGDQSFYSGACATPEYDPQSQFLFTLSTDGDLNAWDTRRNGRRVWGVNIYDQYGAQRRPEVAKRKRTRRDYGYTTSPLVMGEQLIVEVGGNKGNLVAFNKLSGQELWTSTNRDEAGHTGGPVPMTVQGVPCVAVLTLRNLAVTRIDGANAGQTIAVFPWTTDFANNIPTPAVHQDSVIVTSSYNHKSMCRVRIALSGATKVWENKEIQSAVCSPVIHHGRIYWSWRGVHCTDFETGRELWAGGGSGTPGSCVVTSDDRLIVLADNGNLSLVETAERSPEAFTQLASSRVLTKTDAWPHVVVSGGRVICRDRSGDVRCMAITSKAASMIRETTTKVKPNPPTPRPTKRPSKLNLTSWPGTDDPGLFYAWKRGMGQKALGRLASKNPKLVSRNGAKFDSEGRMDVKGGSFLLQGATSTLLEEARKSKELTIETIATVPDLRQVGPARLISFSSDGYHRNFTLAQERDQLLLRLRTPRTGENGMQPQSVLGRIEAGRPIHILVSYRDGELVAYVDGQRIYRGNSVGGDFSNWDDQQQLVFGAEYRDGRSWDGTFDGIALLTRFVDSAEAMRRFQVAMGTEVSDGKQEAGLSDRASPKSTPVPSTVANRISGLPKVTPRNVSLPLSAVLRAGANSHVDGVAELSVAISGNPQGLRVTGSGGRTLKHQWIPQVGSLLVQLPGSFSAGSSETIRVTASSASDPTASDVRISEAGTHEGSECWRIQTAIGNWYFSKTGGGFGSLDDLDGNDWIGFHPTGGSAGNYRGLPNLVHPQGIFHAGGGKTKCHTTVLASGPLAASLLSETDDGRWAIRYDIFGRHVRCTVVKAATAYWFLYEGTPGGKLDLDGNDFVIRDGQPLPAKDRWQGRSHQWVAFADRKAARSLLLVHQTADSHQDSYWPMQGNMTVFGFGRLGLDKFMTATPNTFYVGLSDTVSPSQLQPVAERLANPIAVSISR